MLKIKWLLVLFIINFAHSLSAQKTLGLQLINIKSDTRQYFYSDDIIKISYSEDNKIKKIKGPLVVLNDREVSINELVIGIDKITQIEIQNQRIIRGILQTIGGVVVTASGLLTTILGYWEGIKPFTLIGLITTGSGIIQTSKGLWKFRSNSIQINQIQNRLIVVEINSLQPQKN
jgi:hypothetical protein